MERERLTHLLAEPGNVAKQDLAGLQELTERYPWFSAAHLLLAVGEHSAGDVLFDERARTAAAHVPMRSVLFDLVHAEPPVAVRPEHIPPVAPVLSVAHPQAVAAPLEPIAPVASAPAPPPIVEPAPVNAAMPPLAVEVPATLISPVIDVLPAPVEAVSAPPAPVEILAPPASPVQEPAAGTAEVDPLDQLIRQSALASGYELVMEHALPEVSREAPAPPASGPEPVATPAASPTPVTGRMRFSAWLDLSPDVPVLPPVEESIATGFDEWLHSKPTPPVAAHVPSVTPAPALSPAPAPARAPAPEPTPPVDPFALIDRFIRQEHPEPVKRTEFFTPQQAAKRSLEDHAELVTETLARIYEKQGNVPKAIKAYKRLAERHPERSAHFLDLAKALEGRGKA